ncbi:MAG: aldehyde dehydrogenase family protein, partial [Alphaproteobacteria bacterium]
MHERQFYIDGAWVDPIEPKFLDVIDPSTEEAYAQIALGSAKDVDRAVAAARAAFPAFAATTPAERQALLRRILEAFERRAAEFAAAVSREMGAPATLARNAQAAVGPVHLKTLIAVLDHYKFEEIRGSTLIAKEP